VLRVDLRLRPSPEVTPIVLPIDAAISYYESQALPWEQAAFIRSRAAAGDSALGRYFLGAIQPFIWRRALDFRQIKEIGAVSERIRDHYAQGQAFGPGFDLKRGRGGIREVEFYAQVHQLIFGGRDAALRAPATVDALAALGRAARIDAGDAARLADHYRLYRRIEHRLQMIDDQQTHALPLAADALDRVARLDGLADGDALLALLQPAVADVGGVYDRLVDDARDTGRWPQGEAGLRAALASVGFADVDAAAARIAAWRSGQVRVLRSSAAQAALEAMLPPFMTALARAEDPAVALADFDRMISGLPSAINFFHLLAARPGLATLLTSILMNAPTLAAALAVRADLIDGLIDPDAQGAAADAAALIGELRTATAGCEYEAVLDTVRAMVGERRFALGVQIVEGAADPVAVGRCYGRLAEAALTVLTDATVATYEAAHGRIPGSELVILALGRFGGGTLTHASDLDLIYLFSGDHLAESDGPRPLGATHYFNRLAQRVTAAVSVPTAAGRLYEVDTRLRPSGAQGPLVVSFDSFTQYQRDEAWTWEHMALTRARVVYGSPAARAALDRIIAEILHAPRDLAKLVVDAADMRGKMAAHKPPTGPLDVKNASGGLVDLEFAIHVVQLTHRTGFAPALDDALTELAAAGLADSALVADEALLTRLLVSLRLVAPDGDPQSPGKRALIARACGMAGWDALRDAQAAAQRRIGLWWQVISRAQEG
jgi:glutamate-ammonia-ligase adenylyltransferase